MCAEEILLHQHTNKFMQCGSCTSTWVLANCFLLVISLQRRHVYVVKITVQNDEKPIPDQQPEGCLACFSAVCPVPKMLAV